MIRIYNPSKIKFEALGIAAHWRDGQFRLSAAQTANVIRDAICSVWIARSGGQTLDAPEGISLASLRDYLARRFPAFLPKHSWVSASKNRLSANPANSSTTIAVFRALEEFGDFCHVGRGSYLPRERRVIAVHPGWGRVAGIAENQANLTDCAARPSLDTNGSIGRVLKLCPTTGVSLAPVELSPLLHDAKRPKDLLGFVNPIFERVTLQGEIDLQGSMIYFAASYRPALEVSHSRLRSLGKHVLLKHRSGMSMLAEAGSKLASSDHYVSLQADERRLLEYYFRSAHGAGTRASLKGVGDLLKLELNVRLPNAFEVELMAAASEFESWPGANWPAIFYFHNSLLPLISSIMQSLDIRLNHE